MESWIKDKIKDNKEKIQHVKDTKQRENILQIIYMISQIAMCAYSVLHVASTWPVGLINAFVILDANILLNRGCNQKIKRYEDENEHLKRINLLTPSSDEELQEKRKGKVKQLEKKVKQLNKIFNKEKTWYEILFPATFVASLASFYIALPIYYYALPLILGLSTAIIGDKAVNKYVEMETLNRRIDNIKNDQLAICVDEATEREKSKQMKRQITDSYQKANIKKPTITTTVKPTKDMVLEAPPRPIIISIDEEVSEEKGRQKVKK